EDDEDDEPRSKKKRRDDDDDDDDDEDEPRSSRKKGKKKAGSPLMLIGLIGGGLLVLLLCGGAGITGFLLFGLGTPNVVGKWESQEAKDALGIKVFYEFRADGTGKLDAIGVVHFTYTQNGAELILNH